MRICSPVHSLRTVRPDWGEDNPRELGQLRGRIDITNCIAKLYHPIVLSRFRRAIFAFWGSQLFSSIFNMSLALSRALVPASDRILSARSRFCSCSEISFSSIVSLAINRYTVTGRVCPIR